MSTSAAFTRAAISGASTCRACRRVEAQHALVRRVGGEMQALQARRRLPDAVVQDDADQLGQRFGTVGRAADRRGVRRHQGLERVAEPPPSLVDAGERVFLEQDADALVLGALVLGPEQPGVAVLASAGAGLQHGRAGGGGVLLQMADQPQLQWVHARDVGAVREREALGRIGVVQSLDFALAHRGQMGAQERGELVAIGGGPDRTVDHGEPVGTRPHLTSPASPARPRRRARSARS